MINSTFLHRKPTISLTLALALASTLLLTSCGGEDTDTETENAPLTQEQSVLEVTTVHNADEDLHLFEMSTHEIPNGWTTFEFNNVSGYDHFFLIWKVPQEGIDAAGNNSLLEYWYENITKPFQEEFNPYVNGEIEFGQFTENLVGKVSASAPWFFDPGPQTMGGPGFTSAGSTSKTTVYLEPGEYIAECYVKNEDEIFHSYIGMLEHFSVTQDASGNSKPVPTTQLTISSTDGIQFDEDLEQGDQIVEISFEDQTTYAHLQGHNVQLVKLTDKDDQEVLNNLSNWFDWRQPGSLVNRSPEGTQLMGGSMEMTEGGTAYYSVRLMPGDYAWIAEIPDPADHNMLKTFTITE